MHLTCLFLLQKREDAETYFNKLKSKNRSCALHIGGAEIETRFKTMQNFVDGTTKVLLATDFIGRAVDFPNVSIIVNFDLPLNGDGEPTYKLYLQRVGRTGRFGRDGIVLTILSDFKSVVTYKKISESLKFKTQRLDF